MTAQERTDLWSRLEAFEFDSPDTTLTFARRLARENGWPIGHARRAIREYRRFLFLAMTAGHPVTPSDAVDQVWHLHLTYTRSYWHGLCREILGHPLHHEPTRGGAAEGAKFDDWYARTKASYAAAFAEEPPADLWPPAEVRFGSDLAFVRVNPHRHWLLPKPEWRGTLLRRGRLAALLGLGAMATGCGLLTQTYPFTLTGRSFLVFFPLFAVLVFSLAGWLRWRLRRGDPGVHAPDTDQTIDPYLVAFLAGGQARAVQAAVVSLVSRKAARDLAGNGSVVTGPVPLPAEAHPFEKAVHSCLDSLAGQTVRDLALGTRAMGTVLRDDLERRGWWLSQAQARWATAVPLLIAALVPLVAAFRTWQGMSTDHPSGFIGLGTVVTAVLTLVLFGRSAGRSRAGSVALGGFRREHRASRPARSPVGQVAGGPGLALLPLAVGLFGSSALAGTELERLRRTLQPADQASGGCGTSSGCGTGGDGGGDGGGGGGCGGCGGGGD